MKKKKNKPTALGVYDHEFNSFATIDPSVNHKLGEDSTILHELVHMQLTNSTSYGLLVHILFKLGKYEPRLAKTADVLQSHMLHVQEGLAVFLEMIYQYEKSGKDACISYLKDMKETEQKYYAYLKPLEFLILEHDYISINEKLEIAMALAIFALSGDLKKIEPYVYKHRLLENAIKNDTSPFSLKLIPDARFQCLIQTVKKLLHEKMDVNEQVILERSGIILFQYTVLDVTELIASVIGEHEQKNRMLEELNKLKEIDPQELYLWVHPTSLKSYKMTTVDIEQSSPLLEEGEGTILLAKLLSDPPYERIFSSIFMDLKTKTNYAFIANNELFIDVLRKTPLPLTIAPTAYKALILQEINDPFLTDVKRPLYVYFDIPYVNSSEHINFFLSDSSTCVILTYLPIENTSILVIKPNIDEEVFILQLIFANQKNYIIDHINSGGLKAKLLFKYEDNIEHDFIQSEHHAYFNDYDQIIKSYMQVGGSYEQETDMYRRMIQEYGSLENLWRTHIDSQLKENK